ncbi:uncharacterized protein LOC119661591 [Hermetia illucens]|uniref:uncharacterized protein LOC119661591 n=1 Tax=Hermetia illucens TaxID=343691 RepID=UPI0018CC19B9|nr:uncharacterized protein LOC119661591 [Hermetia illucens]
MKVIILTALLALAIGVECQYFSYPCWPNLALGPDGTYISPTQGAPAWYLARNRGGEHSAPLPGHSLSALSLNVAPAPGTA